MNGMEIARLFGLCDFALQKNIEGVTHEKALTRRDGGTSINWVLGHVVATRRSAFKLAGLDLPWTIEYAEKYGRGSSAAAIAGGEAPLSELLDLYESTQSQLAAWLEDKSEAQLSEPLPGGPHELLGETLGQALSGLAWHEGYHVGQIGALRHEVGLEGAIA